MSEHTKKHHTKASKSVLCVSEQGEVYQLPRSIIKKYIVHDEALLKKAKKISRTKSATQNSITPDEAFSEINAKYTKTGALLKAVRLRAGLSQKEFALTIDVTQGDLSKMERGKRPIGKMLVARIAKKYGSKI